MLPARSLTKNGLYSIYKKEQDNVKIAGNADSLIAAKVS
jgi:hypothetical protein